MQILCRRSGFQADHSSSSYLFYAADRPVSAEGQQIAHRYSSRAEVDKRSARYIKWGESDLAESAYKALLDKHYDVMVSESYDWWTIMIALPKTTEMKKLLKPFCDARGYDDLGVDVDNYPSRLVAVVYCRLKDNGADFAHEHEDVHGYLVKLLTRIRAEILRGDASFLQAVADFYCGDGEEDEEDNGEEIAGRNSGSAVAPEDMSKADLQEICKASGVSLRKTWTKADLIGALHAKGIGRSEKKKAKGKKPSPKKKLSGPAREILASLEIV